MNRDEFIGAAADALAKKMVDDGHLVEAGWVIFQGLTLPPDAPQMQRNDMRIAFLAGAQHVFSAIMMVLDPGDEPSERDMRRIESIATELEDVRKMLELHYKRPKGSA